MYHMCFFPKNCPMNSCQRPPGSCFSLLFFLAPDCRRVVLHPPSWVGKGAGFHGRSSCYCQLLCVIHIEWSPILGPHRPLQLYACAQEWSLSSITPPRAVCWTRKEALTQCPGNSLPSATSTSHFLCPSILHREWHFSVWVESHTTFQIKWSVSLKCKKSQIKLASSLCQRQLPGISLGLMHPK